MSGTCTCGTIWGSLATDEDRAACVASHGPVLAPQPAPQCAEYIVCATPEKALALERALRPTHVVGRVGAMLYVRSRAGGK